MGRRALGRKRLAGRAGPGWVNRRAAPPHAVAVPAVRFDRQGARRAAAEPGGEASPARGLPPVGCGLCFSATRRRWGGSAQEWRSLHASSPGPPLDTLYFRCSSALEAQDQQTKSACSTLLNAGRRLRMDARKPCPRPLSRMLIARVFTYFFSFFLLAPPSQRSRRPSSVCWTARPAVTFLQPNDLEPRRTSQQPRSAPGLFFFFFCFLSLPSP